MTPTEHTPKKIEKYHRFIRIVNVKTQNLEKGISTPDTFLLLEKDRGCLSGNWKEYWGEPPDEYVLAKIRSSVEEKLGRSLNPRYKLSEVDLAKFFSLLDASTIPSGEISLSHDSHPPNVSHMCINFKHNLKYAVPIAALLHKSVIATYDLP